MCRRCGAEKPQTEYYPKDKTCKDCRKKLARECREANIEYYREYDRGRANNPDRVLARQLYSQTERGKEVSSRAKKRYIEDNPKKREAHIKVGNAVRDGLISKLPCSVCGCCDAVAHHCDYDKPLDILWLCPKHHAEWHKINGEGLNGT